MTADTCLLILIMDEDSDVDKPLMIRKIITDDLLMKIDASNANEH